MQASCRDFGCMIRHTFGSRSAMAGVDLPTLKELMVHTSITTTMRYVHPTPEHKRKAMEKPEQFNTEHVFALCQTGSPYKIPYSDPS
jgi:integrase